METSSITGSWSFGGEGLLLGLDETPSNNTGPRPGELGPNSGDPNIGGGPKSGGESNYSIKFIGFSLYSILDGAEPFILWILLLFLASAFYAFSY